MTYHIKLIKLYKIRQNMH